MDVDREKGGRERKDPAETAQKQTVEAHAHTGIEGISPEIRMKKTGAEYSESRHFPRTEPPRAGNIDICQYKENSPEKKTEYTGKKRKRERFSVTGNTGAVRCA